MPGEVGKPDGPGLPDHETEDAVPPGRGADQRPVVVVNAVGSEALEHAAVAREDANGGIARTDELGGGFDDVLEDAFERHLSDQSGGGDDQALQALLRARGRG